MEEQQQELMFKLSMYEQQINQLQEQVQAVERSIVDLGNLSLGLEELKGKKDSEIMAHIGKGIFVKSKIIDEDLVVDVGGKNFVKKSIPETRKLVEEQIKKLENIKEELDSNAENLSEEINSIIMDAQKESKECHDENCKEHEHKHNH